MEEAKALFDRLLSSQNSDGGWPHARGTSWCEPTAYALLALRSASGPSVHATRQKAINWLLSQQKSSGGWSPNRNVSECTSVTSVVTLALLEEASLQPAHLSGPIDLALQWTANQVYSDDLNLSLLIAKMLNIPPPHAPGSVAWYPGTAGWVIPTALSAITLAKASRVKNRPELGQLATKSCAYLLNRRCVDHGWNHGGSQTRSEDAISYPETTGVALLALRAASVPAPPQSVALARKLVAVPESVEGLSWIQMALQSSPGATPEPAQIPPARTIRDCALRLIALAGREGETVFVS